MRMNFNQLKDIVNKHNDLARQHRFPLRLVFGFANPERLNTRYMVGIKSINARTDVRYQDITEAHVQGFLSAFAILLSHHINNS